MRRCSLWRATHLIEIFKHQFYVISKFISFIMEFSIMTIYVHVHMVLSHFSTSPFSRRDVTLVWPWNITCLPFALICMAIGDVMSQFPFKTEINNCANKIMSCDWYFYFSKPCVVWKNEKNTIYVLPDHNCVLIILRIIK